MIRIAIADDQVLFRKGIISLVNSFDEIEVVCEANTGQELLDQLTDHPVDLVLLDISMPGLNGLQTLQLIKVSHPEIKVVMLSVHDEEKYMVKLIDAGANGYLVKNAEPQEVELAIRTIITNDFYFNVHTLQAMKNSYKYNKASIVLDPSDLPTKREKEILLLLCQEYTTPEIAEKLFISERTVEGHRNNLLQKTGCRNTAGLIIFAIKHDLFDVMM